MALTQYLAAIDWGVALISCGETSQCVTAQQWRLWAKWFGGLMASLLDGRHDNQTNLSDSESLLVLLGLLDIRRLDKVVILSP